MNKKIMRYGLPLLGVILIGALVAIFWPRPTKVALVNFPQFMLSRAVSSSDVKNVSVQSEEDFFKLKNYDFVLAFGMGARWSEEEREELLRLQEKGKVKVHVISATNPDNNISSLDDAQIEAISAYFGNGGARNYRSGFNYIRQEILGKKLKEGTVEPPIVYADNIYFGKTDDDIFSSFEEYQEYYNKNGYRPGAPNVAMLISFASPINSNREHIDEMVASLEQSGLNVYPFSAGTNRLEHLKKIDPSVLLYLPHGKLMTGQDNAMKEWFKERNIPIVTPMTIATLRKVWEEDKQGMQGGFLSQSVSVPEIDGAIIPFALIALEEDEKTGLQLFHTIPGRMEVFTSLINRYINLQQKPNKDKKVAIYYFKGPGQNSLVAQGIETLPSLYNVIKRLRQEGYTVTGLPESEKEFERIIMQRGSLFNSYAEGALAEFIEKGYPQFVSTDSLNSWMKAVLTPAQIESLSKLYGAAPGQYYAMTKEGVEGIAVTAVPFGNIVLLPQPGQGVGVNDFKAVHGSNPVPPYPYVASYLWTQKGFKADVMMHFGTHGSLEFINGKQIALSSEDWTDRLVNDLPHIYYYTIANIGEGMIAKRRSYAQTVSYLAPPFIETRMRGIVGDLLTMTDTYLGNESDDEVLSLKIKERAIKMGYHRDLRLDSVKHKPWTRREIEQLSNFAEELAVSKIPGGMYVTGVPFVPEKIFSSVVHIATDPIAYSLAALDRERGRYTQKEQDNERLFSQLYRTPADRFVRQAINTSSVNVDAALQSLGVTKEEVERANNLLEQLDRQAQMNNMMRNMMSGGGTSMPTSMANMMPRATSSKKTKKGGGHPSWIPKTSKSAKKPDYAQNADKKESVDSKTEATKQTASTDSAARKEHPQMGEHPKGMGMEPMSDKDRDFALAIATLKRTILSVKLYQKYLTTSPGLELDGIVNALNGGYTAPSPGGDYIANPEALPTGRNLYSINAEETPTKAAWDKGRKLADDMLADYAARHNGELPQKVSFTLWSSSFIESEGATIAEIIYLLGCEPIRDPMGRVRDIRLIPREELGRKRVDVVVQTSGQLRDLAASRLYLIQKAVDLASKATDEKDNEVANGAVDAERVLLEKGLSPNQARTLATQRVFGGVNGNYGTGIQAMVESGDKWEKESEVANVYLNNMGAIYGMEGNWGDFQEGLFEAALQNVDAVVQPRQSNSWGALSLDHVYEFMGGLTLAVRHVTGKDPEGYFNDLRNHHRTRVQEIKQAVGVEARTTILNPTYIKEVTKEGQGAANALAETIRNTYGWNVMKPALIDKELWDDIYNTYIKDEQNLGIRKFFEEQNPAALQEMTAVMLETARKGLWAASQEQLDELAKMHAEVVDKYGAGCSGFVCDNASLREFIKNRLPQDQQQQYASSIKKVREVTQDGKSKGQVLKKEEQNTQTSEQHKPAKLFLPISLGVLILLLLVFVIYRRQRGKRQ
ncbi:cobaltochelatase subunit CobN [Porphyromonas circumdentaria]|uniref:cobaltochelatase subunit CobN n=1 Tax=Porphyromonas circumdentaria TaxID=29524 RepID=UPI0026DDB493|nr:cobaltochelatase subunit CobN [Porphyromonas circumdentaria]MDO4722300.1 cobaltochelatase subunit CobN [Porphyromonas circumdentaria]